MHLAKSPGAKLMVIHFLVRWYQNTAALTVGSFRSQMPRAQRWQPFTLGADDGQKNGRRVQKGDNMHNEAEKYLIYRFKKLTKEKCVALFMKIH